MGRGVSALAGHLVRRAPPHPSTSGGRLPQTTREVVARGLLVGATIIQAWPLTGGIWENILMRQPCLEVAQPKPKHASK